MAEYMIIIEKANGNLYRRGAFSGSVSLWRRLSAWILCCSLGRS